MTSATGQGDPKMIAALEESDERYRFLTENIPVQVWTSLPNGQLDYVSEQTAASFGLSSEKLLSDGWQNVLHPDDLPLAVERWTHALMTGEIYEVEFRLKNARGEYAWHLARAVPQRNAAGVIVRWFGTNTNIEEQREHQRQVETLAAHFREHNHLLALEAEVGTVLVRASSRTDALRACAESIVRHLDAAFARVWTIDDAGETLELQVSAGLYTHVDGPHARVPVGHLKIGTIAAERKPHLTNQVVGDPRVGDQAWAIREGMVAFAGYPIVFGDKLLGVVAAFAKHPLSQASVAALRSVANALSQSLERFRAEDRLRESELWLSTTLSSIGDGVIATDPAGRVTFMNPVASGLTGWTSESATGQPLDHVFPIVNEQTRATVESPVAKVLREGNVVGMANHTVLLRRDGTEVAIDDSAAPIRGRTGALSGVVLVFRDADEKRRVDAERERLLGQEQRARREADTARTELHSLFMQAPAPICVLRGPEHVFALANAGYMELVGRGRTIVGLPVRQALPELAAQGFYELLDRVYKTGERFVGHDVPAKLDRRGDGILDDAFVTFVYEAFRDLDGNTAGIFVVAFDVTDAVRAREVLTAMIEERGRLLAIAEDARRSDQERITQAERLLEAERMFASLVDHLPGLAWTARPDGYIDLYNRRWFEYTGTTFEEMQGWGWEKIHDPAMLPKVNERWKHSLATGEPFEMEFPIRGADGSFRWFLTRVQPLRDARGEIVRWFGTNTDIQNLKAERDYQERFMAILGHDLRNPLAAIDMATGILKRRAAAHGGDEHGARILDRVASSSRRMSRMVEQILDLTRSRIGGGLEVNPVPSDLRDMLAGIVDELRAANPTRAIVLNCPSIVGSWDPDRMEQVFSNLISNAIHHGQQDKPVVVEARLEGMEIHVAVHNDGPPIPDELRAKLFDPFRRGSRDSRGAKAAGLGLGLFISREIVTAHGGGIDVRSSSADGTTFHVTLSRTASASPSE